VHPAALAAASAVAVTEKSARLLLLDNEDRSGWTCPGRFENRLAAAIAGDGCDVFDREDFGCCERAVAVGGARELVDVGRQCHAAFLSWLLAAS
jgi:hypothetical protein